MPYLLKGGELEARAKEVGSKALNLERLRNFGCLVPNFVVIPSSVVQRLSPEILRSIRDEIKQSLAGNVFAVRSAALIEDNAEHSFAGQFKTFIGLDKKDLAQAICDVVDQAREYLQGDLSQFSIIIQEYVKADIAGVTFTRHPAGQRQMLIDYHYGIGEELVSGKIKPKSIELFWTEEVPKNPLFLDEAMPYFRKIEEKFGHPQDIEWCIAGGRWYFLQARPITTISREQYQSLLFLDRALPSQQPFLYEQTEISEIAPRPTPFTLSVLKRLYAANGPIQRVYRAHGVDFEARDFLRVIGNQLYIDREEELKTILPNYSYFGRHYLKPVRKSMNGFWRSMKNKRALNKIKVKDIRSYIQKVEQALEGIPKKGTVKDIWRAFDECYTVIFEINLLAGVFVQQLELVLRPYDISAVRILSSSFRLSFFNDIHETLNRTWQGNGLEIADEELFITRQPNYKDDADLEKWWQMLPEWRRVFLQLFIERAIIFDVLRERGRWLTVGYINALRSVINALSKFLTIEECEKGEFFPTEEREREYNRYASWAFPARLTNVLVTGRYEKPKGVSAGIAEGVLTLREELGKSSSVARILYTETLAPDLVQYFGEIDGIVSSHGGILSHLAILAREQHIPVVTNIDFAREGVRVGDLVRIDGDRGEVYLSKSVPNKNSS
ncbi:MAG: PEP/pyruvate-binding domain-containing protein [Patescibacteria group bacterium]